MRRNVVAAALVLVVAGCGGGAADSDAGVSRSSTTLAVTTTTTPAPLGGVTPVAADIPYASESHAQRLDLYVPTGAGPHRLVVFIHGGGWSVGDKRNEYAAGVVPLFVGEGFAVASVNYRLSDEATFPAQLLDVQAAVRWLQDHAAEFDVDGGRVAVLGESAGGHLAALVGVTADPAVQAVVDWYGPVDLLATTAWLDANPVCAASGRVAGTADPAIAGLLGAPAEDVPELAASANPITYVSADAAIPPFLIEHGDADCTVPYQGSVALHEALGDERSTLVIVPGSGHYTDFDAASQVPTVLDFLTTHL